MKKLIFIRELLLPFLRSVVLSVIFIVPSINVLAYTRTEVLDKLNSLGCAIDYSDIEIDSLSNMDDKKFDLWLPYAASKASGNLSPISMYMLSEYHKSIKKIFKKDFEEMNNALFHHNCEEDKFMLMVDFFTPFLCYMNINPDKFVKSLTSDVNIWKTKWSSRPINIINNPSFIQAFELKYNKKHPETNIEAINQALTDVDMIIHNLFSKESLMSNVEVTKKDGVIELKKINHKEDDDIFYFRGDTLSLKNFGTPNIKLKIKQLDQYSRGQDFYSSEETFSCPEYKKSFTININGVDKPLVINIKLNPQDVYNLKSKLLWNEYAKLNKIVENNPSLSIWFDVNHIDYKPKINANVPRVKKEDFLNNANIYAIIDNGKKIEKAFWDGDCITFPSMEEAIKSLAEEKEQRFKAEDEKLAAQIAKDKADQQAREEILKKKSQESNYLNLSIYNLEWLEENGYITIDGYDLIAFASGGGFVTVVNKKGVRKSLRLNEYGKVIGQR